MTTLTRSRTTLRNRRPLRSRPRGFYGLGTATPETEWHINALPTWLDPLFTFQKTWNPDAVVALEGFKPTLGKVFAILGGGLAAYYIHTKTSESDPYMNVKMLAAGAGGAVAAPLLLSGYQRFTRPSPAAAVDDANAASADAAQAQADADAAAAQADASGHPADAAAADQAAADAAAAAQAAQKLAADAQAVLSAHGIEIQAVIQPVSYRPLMTTRTSVPGPF